MLVTNGWREALAYYERWIACVGGERLEKFALATNGWMSSKADWAVPERKAVRWKELSASISTGAKGWAWMAGPCVR